MANKKSAQKRIIQTAKRTEINSARRSRIRTFIRKVHDAINSGDKEAARASLPLAQSEIMRGVSKGIMHKNTASRRVAGLSAAVKKLCLSA